jgi:hypothetical protein
MNKHPLSPRIDATLLIPNDIYDDDDVSIYSLSNSDDENELNSDYMVTENQSMCFSFADHSNTTAKTGITSTQEGDEGSQSHYSDIEDEDINNYENCDHRAGFPPGDEGGSTSDSDQENNYSGDSQSENEEQEDEDMNEDEQSQDMDTDNDKSSGESRDKCDKSLHALLFGERGSSDTPLFYERAIFRSESGRAAGIAGFIWLIFWKRNSQFFDRVAI